ncbi:MAG TPA: hypothetical protein VFC46_06365, partial [Humisphaera sp.]|nr:hypothetical protein [Humisphaera sp.]
MNSENSPTEETWKPFVPAIDEQNPWPGLAPYPVWAAPFFHGREEEIQELLRLVRREDLAVVHGKSGVGKTSLLRAGFIPLLEAEDCMPVVIRLDHSPEAPALVDQVKFAITQAMILLHVDGPAADAEKTLWEYFHRRGGQFWGPRNRLLTPVLIFNKFEELFSLGCATDETRQRTNEFLPHLIDLIDNRQPLEIRRQLLDGATESAQWNFEESGCKVVLCLRKEFVTDLDWLALRALSDEKRLALGMLRGDVAVDSVARAGAAVLDRKTAESIVRFCADSSTAVDVAPPTTPAPGANPTGAAPVVATQSIAGTQTKAPIPAPPSAPAPATGAPIPKAASRRTPPAAAPVSKPATDSGEANVAQAAPSSTVATADVASTTTERKLSKLEVEPALLNLVCRELNAERQRLGQSHIDASQLAGTPADFLKAYYERS